MIGGCRKLSLIHMTAGKLDDILVASQRLGLQLLTPAHKVCAHARVLQVEQYIQLACLSQAYLFSHKQAKKTAAQSRSRFGEACAHCWDSMSLQLVTRPWLRKHTSSLTCAHKPQVISAVKRGSRAATRPPCQDAAANTHGHALNTLAKNTPMHA